MLLGLILAGFPFAGESYYRLLWMVVLLSIGQSWPYGGLKKLLAWC